MADGIKDKVAIIGMGCTKFGEHWDKAGEDLMVEAFQECLGDAGVEKKSIDAAWMGHYFDEVNVGKTALLMSQALKLPYIPVTRVENACASGSESLRAACYAVASGAIDIGLAMGVEKLKDCGYGGLPQAAIMSLLGTKSRFVNPNRTAPGGFAMVATKYFAQYGLTAEEGKHMIAYVSYKSHKNAEFSPKAHLRKAVSIEQIMKAPIIAWPLGLFDCCGVSDGAACAIVCRAEDAKNFQADPIYVKAMQIGISSGEEMMYNNWDNAHIETTVRIAQKAYKEAGITNPREEISVAEVHDCFSITEAVTMEDLQFSPRGRVREDIESGFFDLDGGLPVQPDGGLKCFGHPIGASGLRMMYEIYKQLQGKAQTQERQIKDPKIGLTHNMGGVPAANVSSVMIVGR